MFEFLKDIKELEDVESVEKINKGYSKDKKFKIKLKNKDEYLLLRLSDISLYEQKKEEYEVISKFFKLGFEMSKPISFGICNDEKNVYILLSWIDGVDLSDALPKLSKEEQYLLGRKAGRILKAIHSLKVEDKNFDDRLKIKLLDKIEKYESSDVRVENDNNFIEYVKRNVDKVCGNYSYLHGDFHPSNLILMENNEIGVIDFNRWCIFDSYEEFYKLESFGIEFSIPYCVGQIDSYFEDDVPNEFWEIQAIYVACYTLYSIKWAEKFGKKEILGMKRRFYKTFENYENFKTIIPKWYANYHNNKGYSL